MRIVKHMSLRGLGSFIFSWAAMTMARRFRPAIRMGLDASSTARQVIERFGEGKYLSGKTAIVTGGNSGIGLETCKALASAGARVILCSRSLEAGQAAIDTELLQPGLGGYSVDASNVRVMGLDLSSLQSIKAFADEFIQQEGRLDLLVLNAGIMALPKLELTEAGFEKQIGVNHFGHFYLTQLLLDKMRATPSTAGRIVVLSSSAHRFGDVRPDDLHFSKNSRRYTPWGAYGQSKLANLLYAKGLANRLRGTGLTAVSVHPGVIKTNLWRQSFLTRLFSNVVTSKSIPQGAATTVYACVAPRAGSDELRGAWLEDCGPSLPSAVARDEQGVLTEQLWTASEQQLASALTKAGL